MVGNGKSRCRCGLRYTFGGALCLMAGLSLLLGTAWYLCLIVAAAGGIIILGRRRIFRAGVRRTPDEIVCRYIPWYEGNALFLCTLLPLMAVAMVAAGYAPGNPAWLRFGGIVLLCLMPLIVFSVVSMWRRCFLRVSPSALTVRLAGPKDGPIGISREGVELITPKMIPNTVNGIPSLQVEIAYHAADLSGDTTKTVLLGLQLSVQPINLLNALVAWKDGANDAPRELLNRIEGILRGHELADV